MKILVVSQQYWPENWRIVDVCEELARRGHDVTVLCGLPNNSKGQILSPYKSKEHWKETHNGVSIQRVFEHPRLQGAMNLYRKYRTFWKNGLKAVDKFPTDFDLVFVNQLSPVMQALPGLKYAKDHGKKLLLYCLDVWPASLEVRSIYNRGITRPVYRHYEHISSNIYSSADHIFVSSPAFSSYLSKTFGLATDKMSYLPQYAESLFEERPSPHLDGSRLHNIVYAGNIGKAQDIRTVLRACALLKNQNDLAIHFFGDGSMLPYLHRTVRKEKLANVVVHGRLPQSSMPAAFAAADALLISSTHSSVSCLSVPGRFQSFLAAGKPIIYACDGTVPALVKEAGCGFGVSSGDSKGLAALFLKMVSMSPEERDSLGKASFSYYDQHFNKNRFFEVLENEMYSLSEGPQAKKSESDGK